MSQVFILTILYLSILYITYRPYKMSKPESTDTPYVAFVSADDWINRSFAILNGSMGISKFNQAIPLLVSGVAVGVSLVNRNFPKCIGHITGATIVALISVAIIAHSNNRACNQFTTSFLWYTIVYISFCMESSKNLDANTLIGIIFSLTFLVFIDFITFLGGECETMGQKIYIGMILLGVVGGIAGYYMTMSIGGPGAVYDLSVCSCDDCADKCSIGCKTQIVLAKQLNTQ